MNSNFFDIFMDMDQIVIVMMQEIITAGHYQNLYPNPCKHVCIIKF